MRLRTWRLYKCLSILTFTGVDEKTDLAALRDISRRYPRVEWGVLVGSHTDSNDRGIYPVTTGQ